MKYLINKDLLGGGGEGGGIQKLHNANIFEH